MQLPGRQLLALQPDSPLGLVDGHGGEQLASRGQGLAPYTVQAGLDGFPGPGREGVLELWQQ